MKREDAQMRIGFLNCCEHLSNATIGEAIGLGRVQVSDILTGTADIHAEPAEKLEALAASYRFAERITSPV